MTIADYYFIKMLHNTGTMRTYYAERCKFWVKRIVNDYGFYNDALCEHMMHAINEAYSTAF